MGCFVACGCVAVEETSQSSEPVYGIARGSLEVSSSEIQLLLDDANPGDWVVLEAGTWEGDLSLPEGVHLEGAGADHTVLLGSLFVSSGSTVKGLTIRSDEEPLTGTGLLLQGDGIVARELQIQGWALGVSLESALEGIALEGIELSRSRIEENGTGVLTSGAVPLRVWSNVFSYQKVRGIRCEGVAELDVRGNTFFGNSQSSAGWQLELESIGCGGTVHGNVVAHGSRGILCDSCPATIANNLIYGHAIDTQGVLETNVYEAPLFADPGEGDFRLLPGSPAEAIGTGTAPGIDFEGSPRGESPWDAGAFVALLVEEEIRFEEILYGETGAFVEWVYTGTAPLSVTELYFGDGDSRDVLVVLAQDPVVPDVEDAGDAGDTGGTGDAGDAGDAGDGLWIEPGERVVLIDDSWEGAVPPGLILVPEDGILGDGLSPRDRLTLQRPGHDEAFLSPLFRWQEGRSVVRLGDASLGWHGWGPSPCEPNPGVAGCSEPASLPELHIVEVYAQGEDSFVEVLNVGENTLFLDAIFIGTTPGDAISGSGENTKLSPGMRGVFLEEGSAFSGLDLGVVPLVFLPAGSLAGATLPGATSIAIYDAEGTWVASALTAPIPSKGESVEALDPWRGDHRGNWGLSGCETGHSLGTKPCEPEVLSLDFILREVLLNAEDEGEGRFIEVLNVGRFPVSGESLVLADERAIRRVESVEDGAVIYPGGRGLITSIGNPQDFPVYPGGLQLQGNEKNAFALPFASGRGLVLMDGSGRRVVDAVFPVAAPNNGIALQHAEHPVLGTGVSWEPSVCEGGMTPGTGNCISLPVVADVVVSEVQSHALSPEERFVEIFNRSGLPVNVAGWRLAIGAEEANITANSGQGAVLGPLEWALIMEENSLLETGPTLVLEEDFEDGSVGVAGWEPYHTGSEENTVVEHDGELIGTLLGAGGVGVVATNLVNFAARTLKVETTLSLPFSSGGTVYGVFHLGSDKTGPLEGMAHYLQVRFEVHGSEHNLRIERKIQGEAPVTIWSWQDEPFCCPGATQNLRFLVDHEHITLFYGPTPDDVFGTFSHGLDPEIFASGYPLLAIVAPQDLGAQYEGSFGYISIERTPFVVSSNALMLGIDGGSFGPDFSSQDSVSWAIGGGEGLFEVLFPWEGTSVERSHTLDSSQEGWGIAPCGVTPGRSNCLSGEVFRSRWWDFPGPLSEKVWKRIVGVPESPGNCAAFWGCDSQPVWTDATRNFPAASEFVFRNPYGEHAVRFQERLGPYLGCETPCLEPEIVVAPGAEVVLPPSSGGFYYVETVTGVFPSESGIPGGAQPPPEGMLPIFGIEGEGL